MARGATQNVALSLPSARAICDVTHAVSERQGVSHGIRLVQEAFWAKFIEVGVECGVSGVVVSTR